MTPAALVAALAARGVRLTVVGNRLHVNAPTGELTAADREMLTASKRALLPLLEDEGRDREALTVADVLDIFPGARVVQDGQPAVWPPTGGWIPSSALDPYTSAPPTGLCSMCRGTSWRWAGGWTCARCHPAPREAARDSGGR
jgi:hypothetical protein